MQVVWLQIGDPAAYVRHVLNQETPDIPADRVTAHDWVQTSLTVDALQVDSDMITAHDSEPVHIDRRDRFIASITARDPIPPLIALGAELFLVDGYARYRALRSLGLSQVSVLRQHS